MMNHFNKKSSSFFANSIFSGLGFLWPLVLTLFITPVILDGLGKEKFGIWVIVSSFIGILGLLNLGLSSASLKYLSEYYSKKDYRKFNIVFTWNFIIYSTMGFLGIVVTWLTRKIIAEKVINVDPNLVSLTSSVLFIASFVFATKLFRIAFFSAFKAIQNYKIFAFFESLYSSAFAVFAFIVLRRGLGLKGLVTLHLILGLLFLGGYYFKLKEINRNFRFTFSYDSLVKKLLNFSFYSFLSNIFGVLYEHADKLIISNMLGTTLLTYYALPYILARKVQVLFANLTHNLFPKVSELDTLGNRERLQQMYIHGTKLLWFLISLLTLPIFLSAKELLVLWVGTEIATKSWVIFRILLITFTVGSVNVIPYYFFYGLDKPKLNMIFTIISGVTNVSSLMILIPRYGIIGAAVANLLGVMYVFVMLYVCERLLGISSMNMVRHVYLPILLSWMVTGIMYQIAIHHLSLSFREITSILITFVSSIVFFCFILYMLKYFGDYKLSWAKEVFRKLGKA